MAEIRRLRIQGIAERVPEKGSMKIYNPISKHCVKPLMPRLLKDHHSPGEWHLTINKSKASIPFHQLFKIWFLKKAKV